MFNIPDFLTAPRLCKQAGLDLSFCVIRSRSSYTCIESSTGDLRHFDMTVRCAAHYARATLRHDPSLNLGFWSFLTSVHHGKYGRKSREASSVKTALKDSKEKLVKCTTKVVRLCCVSIQSCTQYWPSPKVQSRLPDWIETFYCFGYVHEVWHSCFILLMAAKTLPQFLF